MAAPAGCTGASGQGSYSGELLWVRRAMVASRLSDSQKNDIVQRYRAGETSTELARAFGCSANTVSRVVKAALDPTEYERLKQGRGRAARAPSEASPAAPEAPPAAEAELDPELLSPPPGRRVLAIDDADDFAEDDSDEADGDSDDARDTGDSDDPGDLDDQPVVVPVLPLVSSEPTLTCRPLAEADLPEIAYLLVDKLVELQAHPLREFTDLGPIPEEEAEQQAVILFLNPRQAKRHCGRNQRVIQLPDPSLLRRTAPYLVAQGISRLVIDGRLFALTEAERPST